MMRKVGVVLAIGLMAVPMTGAGTTLEDAEDAARPPIEDIQDPIEWLLWLAGQAECAVVEILEEPPTQGGWEIEDILETPMTNATIPVARADGNVSWVRFSIAPNNPRGCNEFYCISFEMTGLGINLNEIREGTDFETRPNIFVRFFSGGATVDNGPMRMGAGFWTVALSRDDVEAQCDVHQSSGE